MKNYGIASFINGRYLRTHLSSRNIVVLKREASSENLFDPHLHDEWELKIFAETGIVLIPPKTVHPATRPEQQTFSFSVEKDVSYGVYMWKEKKDSCKLNRFYCMQLEELCMAPFSQLCKKTAEALQEMQNDAGKKYAVALLELFFSSLSIVLDNEKKDPDAKIQSKVEKASQYINRYYYKHGLSAKEIAASVSVTPNYLAALFKKEKEQNIIEILTLVRLQKAYKLLRSGEFTVKEAAELTGWNSQFYFANCFRKHYKVTPSSLKNI